MVDDEDDEKVVELLIHRANSGNLSVHHTWDLLGVILGLLESWLVDESSVDSEFVGSRLVRRLRC